MLPGSVSCCPALALNCGKAAPLSMLEAGHLPLATAWLQVLGNRGYLRGCQQGPPLHQGSHLSCTACRCTCSVWGQMMHHA